MTEKILASVSDPIDVNGESRRLGASVGISLYPSNGETSESLLAEADSAMYAVKRSGRNGFRFAG